LAFFRQNDCFALTLCKDIRERLKRCPIANGFVSYPFALRYLVNACPALSPDNQFCVNRIWNDNGIEDLA
jgi:hypothetical protein